MIVSPGLSLSPFQHNPRHTPQNPLLQHPIHDKYTQLTTLTTSSSSAPATSIQTKPTNYSINSIKSSSDTGSRNLESTNCEKDAHRTTNSRKYQPPKITVPSNVIETNRIENSDTQFIIPIPANKIQNTSKAVIRSSPPKTKYDFRNNNNNITSQSKYAGHLGGKQRTTNKNSSQRKIGEGEKSTDRGEYRQSIVPPSYVPAKN